MRPWPIAGLLWGLLALAAWPAGAQTSLLNVSYDPTRELYAEMDRIFEKEWQKKTGKPIQVRSSHGGSGAQARAVIDGLAADVVTLGVASDIDAIARSTSLIPKDWRKKLPNDSSPYYSTILLVVRKGNPKNIKDWPDLIKPGVEVILPNPKTSAGARWSYMAAWGYALAANGGDEARTRDFIKALYHNVVVLDTGARAATISFVQRRQGDVLVAWEDDALLAVERLGRGELEIVVPSISIRAEPVVAVVEGNVERRGTQAAAAAYLQFLYTPEGQELSAKHYYRPNDPTVAARWSQRFIDLPMLSIEKDFGGWAQVQAKHFATGGVFDQIYQPGP